MNNISIKEITNKWKDSFVKHSEGQSTKMIM
jgi:hypothetical protein